MTARMSFTTPGMGTNFGAPSLLVGLIALIWYFIYPMKKEEMRNKY